MNSNKPFISVVMSVYNGEKYLSEAIKSILDQSFSDFEFIIFDDGSTDDSLGIIESFNDTRIKLIKNKTNRGLTKNLIEGLNIAKGKYVARMDADDISLPDRFKTQAEYLEANSDISILGSSVIFFNDNGYEFIAYQPITNEEIKVHLLFSFTLLHPSVMMRIDDLRRYNLNYNPEFKYSQDHDLWVRASMRLKLANIHEPLIKMREHTDKITSNLKPQQKYYSDKTRLRQLKNLDIVLNSEELSAFNNLSAGTNSFNLNQLKLYEKSIIKIINNNKHKRIYAHSILLTNAAYFFRMKYRQLLLNNNNTGLIYWTSPLRKYDKISLRNNITLALRSIKAYLTLSILLITLL